MIRVLVGGWEHECCGDESWVGDIVQWSCLRDDDRLLVERHGDERAVEVRGRIATILALGEDGSRTPVVRLPSGRELSLRDPYDGPPQLVHAETSEPVAGATHFEVELVD